MRWSSDHCIGDCRFIQVHLESEERDSKKFHFFNSFFYKKLTEKSGSSEGGSKHRQNHERVRKWTKVGQTMIPK